MILAILLIISCAPRESEPPSYAEKNGWYEIPSPRPDIQCWHRRHGDFGFCTKALNSTYGAAGGTN